ncbi:MAG: transporter associated domain-containing protein [Cardiobacteriaceae bacterium]|nr:transporter associated domain-containing protein [Cardiobacteriaceae bacterium]
MNAEENPPQRTPWLQRLTEFFQNDKETPREELLALIRETRAQSALPEESARMMEALLQLQHKQVRDIMIPRGQMIVIEEQWSLEKVLAVVLESGHSRYPVVDEAHESVRGILLSKDLLPVLASQSALDLPKLWRVATVVPESKALESMLSDFRSNRNHMAVVIDEYGTFSGLVTIEDVLEEIVGEIDDEHDVIDDEFIVSNPDGSFNVKALTTIEHFNQAFQTQLSDEDADTIGGYVLQLMGKMPEVGESVEFAGYHVVVSKANQRRLLALVVRRLEGVQSALVQ